MGKKVVTWRVPDGVLARLDEIAEAKSCTRSAVLDAAVSNYLDDAGRGPVELSPARAVPEVRDARPRAFKSSAEMAARRDELLATAKERAEAARRR